MASFAGGIHPDYEKITQGKKIRVSRLPKKVVIPLMQHTGVVCKPLINVGDHVKVGQKIGDVDAFISAPLHASISGKVTEIKEMPHPVGTNFLSIIIESDGKIEWHESVKPNNVESLSKEDIIKIIREAGIVGLGGAAFPTHVKLTPKKEKKIDTVILNGSECEPFLTSDHRLMIEETEKIIKGLKLIMKAVDAEKAFIGVEDNKKNAIALLKDNIKDSIEVVELKTKYPQGAEKMLIYSITKRKVPPKGLPLDIGVIVNNVGTAKAVYDAVYDGKPLVERVVTVTGAVNSPENLLVKNGTIFRDIINECGGYKTNVKKLIMGGPLMGIALSSDNVPVVKATTGILVLDKIETEEEKTCIRCSKCVDVCPMFLVPTTIAKYTDKNMIKEADSYNALDCFECGCCAYVCPSKIPLVQKIKYAKAEILKLKEK